MKKLLTLLLCCAAVSAAAQDFGQDESVRLWDNTTAPHSNSMTRPDNLAEGDLFADPTLAALYVFRADPQKATGQGVVICPGGSYSGLAIGHEGCELARWLASNGVTAAVLKYRMPNGGHREVPLEDAVAALRYLREHAGTLGIDAAKVGIVGSSAGGHLAASASTLAADADKPAFAVLFYPVITGERGKCHEWSFDNLLGADRTEELTRSYSLENRVGDTTPPTLIFFSDDDDGVPTVSGTRYYDALKRHGIRASLHIYPSGGHGWGIRDDFRYKAQWQEAMLDWLRIL